MRLHLVTAAGRREVDVAALAPPTRPAAAVELNGVPVFVRRLTPAERDRVLAVAGDEARPGPERAAELCRLLLGDATNNRLFGDDPADVEAALGIDDAAAEAVIRAGLPANGFPAWGGPPVDDE